MFQCVHFWGWKALESSADHSDAAAPKEMTGFQMTLCSILVRKLRQERMRRSLRLADYWPDPTHLAPGWGGGCLEAMQC